MNFFNRKELYITFSQNEKDKVVAALSNDNIKYTIKVINRNSPSVFSDTRNRTGSFGQNMQIAYEYIIYVEKKDYLKAYSLINTAK